jgi:DNA-binding transcriptional MerR regulator
MVERLKAKLKLLEQLTDAIRQGLTLEDIRKIFSSRNQLNQMKERGKHKKDRDHE